jgi:hypothetical protein
VKKKKSAKHITELKKGCIVTIAMKRGNGWKSFKVPHKMKTA